MSAEAQLPVLAERPEAEGEDDEAFDDKVSQDHLRLLFLVSLYSKPAENDEEKEIWIRSHAVMVLVFEGIVTGVLNYDYSSCAVAIGSERVWMNLSQEGKDDLDDLREMKMINTIKLSTADQGSVQGFQISFKGQKLLKRKLTQSSQDAVNSFCFTADGQPLHVGMQDQKFFFYTSDKEYKVVSKVTDTEDVSYVSSPYLPDCIRRGLRGMTSNAHRAYESAAGKSDIKDEYSEVVSLGEVRVIIGEWLPFGDNAISSLMDKLGCQDRIQGGFFSDVIDKSPQDEVLETPSGLTGVRMLEFDLLNFVNFEADIHFAEDEGIVQVENFGTHVRTDGFVLYGIKIEAIMDHGADNVSLDLLSRLLMDMQHDSTRIIDSLVSEYQRSLLDMIFYGDRFSRDKYNIIFAEMINPKMSAELYLDGKEHESEIKQVIGDAYSSHNLSDDDVLIIGKLGLLVTGRGSSRYEPLCVSYLTMICRERFVKYFYARVFLMDQTLRQIRELINHYDEDPNSVSNVRKMMGDVSRGVILLDECLLYLEESLAHCSLAGAGGDKSLQLLASILNAGVLLESLKRRVADMRKNVKGASVELVSIQKMTGVISDTQQGRMQDVLTLSASRLNDIQKHAADLQSLLVMVKTFLTGLFAFEIMDRLLGFAYVSVDPTAVAFTSNVTMLEEGVTKSAVGDYFDLIHPIVAWPGVQLVLALICWFVINKLYSDRRLMALREEHGLTRNLIIRYTFNVPINLQALQDMLMYKYVVQEDLDSDESSTFKKLVYNEMDTLKWRGDPPKVEILYDSGISYLLRVAFHLNRSGTRLTPEAVYDLFIEDLVLAQVINVQQSKELLAAFSRKKGLEQDADEEEDDDDDDEA